MIGMYGRSFDLTRTLVHDLMFIILGLMTSISGPTLLDLKQSVGTDSYGISFIFTARSIGYIIGATTGGIVLDWLTKEDIAIVLSSLFVALGAYAIPWCRSLPVLLCTFAVTGFAMGFSNTGSNASTLRIWGKKGAPFLQGLHFAYGLGGFFGPLLAAPFLTAQNTLHPNTTVTTDEILPITYAYSIVGVAATLVCGGFITLFFLSKTQRPRDTEINVVPRDPGRCFTVGVVILACLQTGLVSGVEVSFTQMLTSYAVKSGMTKVVGSYITSVYWGAYTFVRFISIPLAFKVSIKKMLMFDLVVSMSATVVLLTVGTRHVAGLWTGAAMLGIGFASLFPATLSWVEKYIHINNRIASCFTLVSSILEMTVPLMINIYLDTFPNLLFYFMLSGVSGVCCIFVMLNYVTTQKGEKYDSPEEKTATVV